MTFVLQDHAKLVSFFSECHELIGRKKLQKMIYILKKCDYPFSERYQFHFYGPYSEELTLRVQELINLGFLEEEKEKKKGFYQYRYSITEEGQKFLTHYNINMPDMDQWIEKMKGMSSRFLELIATMLYFDNRPKEEIEDKVFTVKKKQNYTREELERAWEFIAEMNVKH
ncbi:YwgA family protein [Salinibacillus aidingensis]|uniref:YwgA family protein n=1 Tax=Salinibacillus aidingensis TaxID=237684 RepID=A0ABN1B0N8_9BACI